MRNPSYYALTIACATLVAQVSQAAPKNFVYTHQSRDLFEIVTEKDQESKLDPGIYKIQPRTGELLPLVLGKPVGVNRSYKGVLSYADTGAHEFLSIVDGKLVLLNFNSNPKAVGSALRFGEGGRSGAPLIDVLSGMSVQVPLIQNVEDIHVFTGPIIHSNTLFPKGARVYVVSVKASSILGKGLTFAFVVEGKSGNDKVSIYNGRAIVLAYEFMDEASMSRLIVLNSGHSVFADSAFPLYSPLLIQNTQVNLPGGDEFPAARQWDRQLSRFLSFIFKGRTDANLQEKTLRVGIPTYDLISGKPIYPDLPLEPIHESANLTVQVYDPFSRRMKLIDLAVLPGGQQGIQKVTLGNSTLMMARTDQVESATFASMEIQRNPKNGNFYLIPETRVTEPTKSEPAITKAGNDNFLFFSDNKLYIAVRQAKSSDSSVQILNLDEFRSEAGDRIEFVKLSSLEVNGRKFRTYLISRQGKRAEKSQVYSLILEGAGALRVVSCTPIFEGPFISPTELLLRTKYVDGSGPVFDNITPVQGPGVYRRDHGTPKGFKFPTNIENTATKTIPYLRLFASLSLYGDRDSSKQQYLLALAQRSVIAQQLYFKEYEPRGATENATGFYLMKPESSATSHPVSFYPGYPLHIAKDRSGQEINHIVDSSVLTFPSSQAAPVSPLRVSLIPFLAQMPKVKDGVKVTPRLFRLGLAVTSDSIGSSAIQGMMGQIEVPMPYGSLAYTKIIQGIKNRSEQFHVLLYFREDPKIVGSQNLVVIINGTVNRADLINKKLTVQFSDPQPIYRGIINRSDYRAHLKIDPEGGFYWDEDPSIGFDHAKKRIRKLSDPGTLVQPRQSGHLSLRDAEHLKDSEIGVTNRLSTRGGIWEIYSKESLRSRVQGLSDQLEEFEKKNSKKEQSEDPEEQKPKDPKVELAAEKQILESFETYLDRLAALSPNQNEKVKVILVEPALRDKFRFALMNKLVKHGNHAHSSQAPRFSLNTPKFRFFYAQLDLDDVEIAEELRYISNGNKEKRSFLFVEPSLLKQSSIVSRVDHLKHEQSNHTSFDQEDDSYYGGPEPETVDPKTIFKFDNIESPASMTALLASGGQAKTVRGWKRVRQNSQATPSIVISTPQEWREITTSEANRKEYEGGLYDRFELVYDYLTAGWSVWGPGTDRTPDDVRAIGKSLYNSDEMKVFPTLDVLLDKAARGQLKGQQTIVIVPPELKPIIQKLVMLRWATHDGVSAGLWNHANRDLALFRVSPKDASQANIQDNFRAIAGASQTRNAVLISDLDTIEKIGRPVNSAGRNFSLRDPVRVVRDILDEGAGANPIPAPPPNPLVANAQMPMTQFPFPLPSSKHEFAHLDYHELTNLLDEHNQNIELYNTLMNECSQAFRAGKLKLEQFQEKTSELNRGLSEVIEVRDSVSEALSNLQPTAQSENQGPARSYPHMLWWIAAEGRPLQPRRARGWNLKDAVDRHAATILVGTEEELMRLEGDLAAESKFFSIQDHFNLVRLSPPDESTRFKLLQSLFEKENVRALGLEFKLEDGNNRDPRNQLIYHFINRVEQIAYDIKLEKTTAFVKAFTALKNSLAEDLELRRNRQFDVRFVERLFTKVFPMPLNVEILEPKDPLSQLQNVDNAIRGLTKNGYEGSQDLKRRFIQNILSQTRPTDSSRPIPNSQIIFGKTSKGKTFLIQTMFKALGMVEYNPNKASNAEADYIFINVAKLTHDKTADPDKIPVDKAIEWIYDLMAQPNGARASIVFDDFHKAISVEVRKALFQFIQGLFEARHGMITVHTRDQKKFREIPVQNLNLYMTINPASSEKARAEYIRPGKSYGVAELLKLEVLAAIAEGGFKPEESVLARWADIINIDNFPRSAKVPELGKRVRQHSRSSREMILVDPDVIDRLVSRFEDSNARELLSPAASALTSIPSNAKESRLYLVSLRDDRRGPSSRDELISQDDAQVNLQELQSAVRKITQIDAVQINEPKSMLRYMTFIMQNFRLQVFNALAINAHMSDTLRLNRDGMVNLLKTNFLLGVSTHILQNPQIPKGEMVVRPEQLKYFNRVQTDEFYMEFGKLKSKTNFFPPNFALQTGLDLNVQDFISGRHSHQLPPRTRRELLHSYITKIDQILVQFMRLYLRLDRGMSLTDLAQWNEQRVAQWFSQLSETNPDTEASHVIDQMLQLFLQFQDDFNSDQLTDVNPNLEVTLYDEVRIFAYLIDKAITLMPWGTVSKFTYDVAQMSTDFSLGTKTAFKEYIGTHELSPFSIATPEFMTDILGVSQSMTQTPHPAPEALNSRFNNFCESLLTDARGGK